MWVTTNVFRPFVFIENIALKDLVDYEVSLKKLHNRVENFEVIYSYVRAKVLDDTLINPMSLNILIKRKNNNTLILNSSSFNVDMNSTVVNILITEVG